MTERRLTGASFGALFLGIALMVPFEHPATLAVGVACLFAFIVLGVFGLLSPRRLADEPEADASQHEAPTRRRWLRRRS